MSERDFNITGSVEPPAPPAVPAPVKSPFNKGLAVALITIGVIAVVAIFAAIFMPRTSVPAGGDRASYIDTWGSGMQSLTISDDGKVHGTDGCNIQNSSWSFAGNRITFGGFMSTMMACLDEKGEMRNGWLGQSTGASLDGPNTLVFYGQNGEILGSMIRGVGPQPVDHGGPTAPDNGLIAPEPRPMATPHVGNAPDAGSDSQTHN